MLSDPHNNYVDYANHNDYVDLQTYFLELVVVVSVLSAPQGILLQASTQSHVEPVSFVCHTAMCETQNW